MKNPIATLTVKTPVSSNDSKIVIASLTAAPPSLSKPIVSLSQSTVIMLRDSNHLNKINCTSKNSCKVLAAMDQIIPSIAPIIIPSKAAKPTSSRIKSVSMNAPIKGSKYSLHTLELIGLVLC